MKFRILLLSIAITLFILIINSCEEKMAKPAGLGSCDTTALTYTSGPNKMKLIIDAQCGTSNSACHSPSGASRLDYSTYSSQLTTNCQNGSIINDLTSGKMPLQPQPGWGDSASCMIAKFKAWINRGYPQ